jgi:Reverse transcriptase (RNA-dependent DNA polymerase)
MGRLNVTNGAIILALDKLQPGRAVGSDGICAELLKMHCAESVNHWRLLFNMFLTFGYSPSKLLEVKLSPIPKDKAGDLNKSDNYRCIAISSCISKMFELILLEYVQGIVRLSDNQFGFRRNHSTDIAHALLKKIISGFRSRGSYTFLCFLDMSKAFDYVNYWKLFDKLLDRGVARNVIKLLVFWYSNEVMSVQWNSCRSAVFSKSNGVRQGSPLSPFLFSLYIDDLLSKIRDSDVGCKLFGMRANVIGYADDIVLLTPS